MMIKTSSIALLGFIASLGIGGARASEMETMLDEARLTQAAGRSAQEQIEFLDDATQALLSQFRDERLRIENLEDYAANLRAMRADQERERERLEQARRDAEDIRRELVPLMAEMTSILGEFVELDTPFLLPERRNRLAVLQALLGRADVSQGEKLRRIVEAYQIEAEYGQNIEAWTGELDDQEGQRSVEFLRIGRVALYYVTLDQSQAALWDPRQARWQLLPAADLSMVQSAIQVARKQAPPDLLTLPLWTQGRNE